MRKISERQAIIRDLFMIHVLLHFEETNNLINNALNIPSIPTLGTMLYPNDASGRLVIDMLFEDEAEVGNILESVLSRRYLNERLPARTHDEFDLGRLFDMRPADFKQSVRTTKSGFVWLLNQIIDNAVFHNNSRRPQLPILHQLALTLEHLGSNGNGASVGRFARNLSVAHGTVVKMAQQYLCTNGRDSMARSTGIVKNIFNKRPDYMRLRQVYYLFSDRLAWIMRGQLCVSANVCSHRSRTAF
ncbi:hypothetical protein, variant [Puccinia triticina 1-1 BBBD Race 1]|uniref:Uncharacterized protein n=1 Tax=Puccinia triticina (isolate 1-1 / race 1 (BBBD)) TaxID=630390 RepID=A0A180GGV1_PUCT1|nr:hypothetical protein, variant [Puccinia triticina 1-1 BBBD Race 1]